MSDGKRPDPRRRAPGSRPAAAGRTGPAARGRKSASSSPSAPGAKGTPKSGPKPVADPDAETTDGEAEAPTRAMPEIIEPIRQAIVDSANRQAEQRLGFTARRAAILAAVVCVLTLTIAGPVRTFFAQRTEMRQLAATEEALRAQIADLEIQKVKLADPAFIASEARERLGFVMPGDIPYQVQLPEGAVPSDEPGAPGQATAPSSDPWYTALWKTIADEPHGPHPPPAGTVGPEQLPPGEVPPGELPPIDAPPPAGPGG
ncbi:MAG TPA: septum formation initiator family protein [Mycolicibacterium fallax]|nr:septum formation initiator family protein [Mycolicibacterium fallax]